MGRHTSLRSPEAQGGFRGARSCLIPHSLPARTQVSSFHLGSTLRVLLGYTGRTPLVGCTPRPWKGTAYGARCCPPLQAAPRDFTIQLDVCPLPSLPQGHFQTSGISSWGPLPGSGFSLGLTSSCPSTTPHTHPTLLLWPGNSPVSVTQQMSLSFPEGQA